MINAASKFLHVEFRDCAGKTEGAAPIRNVAGVFRYEIHTVLIYNGIALADLPKSAPAPAAALLARSAELS